MTWNLGPAMQHKNSPKPEARGWRNNKGIGKMNYKEHRFLLFGEMENTNRETMMESRRYYKDTDFEDE